MSVWYYRQRLKNVPRYSSPTPGELAGIEQQLKAAGVEVHDFSPAAEDFQRFEADNWFPVSYHGGPNGGVWAEKLLEHWISFRLLGLDKFEPGDIYVDIAAAASPWARALRNRLDVSAYANDMGPVPYEYRELAYYRSEDATNSAFSDESVSGASLHCSYEMFSGKADELLINELARILKPHGKAIIVPLYMHTHYCAYSTPEHYGKGYSDPDAREYLRFDASNIPSSRKYDVTKLRRRVLDRIVKYGMTYRLLALRNKKRFGPHIYCHFILEISK